MIKTFCHKGLKRLFEQGKASGVSTDLVPRVIRRLDAIDAATAITDLALPGFDLHALKGERAGTWSVKVSGNWPITFRFESGAAHDVDLEDYH